MEKSEVCAKKIGCFTIFSMFLRESLEEQKSVLQAVLEAIRRLTEKLGDDAVVEMILDTFTDEEVKRVLRRRYIKEALSV